MRSVVRDAQTTPLTILHCSSSSFEKNVRHYVARSLSILVLRHSRISCKNGYEPNACCTYDKEFIRITSKEADTLDTAGAGELLWEGPDDDSFVIAALRAIGVKVRQV